MSNKLLTHVRLAMRHNPPVRIMRNGCVTAALALAFGCTPAPVSDEQQNEYIEVNLISPYLEISREIFLKEGGRLPAAIRLPKGVKVWSYRNGSYEFYQPITPDQIYGTDPSEIPDQQSNVRYFLHEDDGSMELSLEGARREFLFRYPVLESRQVSALNLKLPEKYKVQISSRDDNGRPVSFRVFEDRHRLFCYVLSDISPNPFVQCEMLVSEWSVKIWFPRSRLAQIDEFVSKAEMLSDQVARVE